MFPVDVDRLIGLLYHSVVYIIGDKLFYFGWDATVRTEIEKYCVDKA